MAVVVAGRSGTDVLAPLRDEPVLVHSVRGLVASGVADCIVVVVPAGIVDAVAAVRACLDGCRVLLVHDATRPLTPPALAESVTRSVDDDHAVAVPVLPLADTVKRVESDGNVVGGPDRSGLRVVQTPQAFRTDVLHGDALARVLAADPAAGWATVDVPAVTVPGHPLALPVRTAWDRTLAEVLAAEAVAAGAVHA